MTDRRSDSGPGDSGPADSSPADSTHDDSSADEQRHGRGLPEREAVPGAERESTSPKRVLLLIGLVALVAAVLAFVVVRLHSAQHDIVYAFAHLRWRQLPWLLAALGAEATSFYCYALVQRRLLRAGGAIVPRRTMLALAVAATGLTNLVPGGTAPASGWLVRQYRRRGIPMPLALWAVLAGGYAATVSVLSLLLVGAGIAGLAGPLVLGVCAVALIAAATAVVLAADRLSAVAAWLERHRARRGFRLVHRMAVQSADVLHVRTNVPASAQVLGLSLANWALDVVVLIGAFGLLGLPIPWRTALFAYAAAQVAGSLAPLPGGIGFVEGGMIGAFALAGSGVGNAVAATVIYRVITSWGMALAGSLTLFVVSRRRPVPAELRDGG